MTRKRLGKVFLVWLCIITLVMPFTSEVFAAALTKDDVTAVLESVPLREGGEESTDVDSEDYDQTQYKYAVSGVDVLKVTKEDDSNFEDTFYCVDASRSLTIKDTHNYKRATDNFQNYSDSEVQKWASSVGITEENYKALMYLLNNLYAKKLDPSYKDTFIEKAFAEKFKSDEEQEIDPPTTVQMVKENLTDDDIEVIQQWAIWSFTNGTGTTDNKAVYDSLGSIEVTKLVPSGEGAGVKEVKDNLKDPRKEYAGILYEYLVNSAKQAVRDGYTPNSESTNTYPSLDKSRDVKMEVDSTKEYYKVGPFKINGETAPSNFKITVSSEGGDLTSLDYKVYEGENDVTSSKRDFNFDFNKDYYIYLPIESKISSIKVKIEYNKNTDRNLSLWVGQNEEENLQPLVLILQEPGEVVTEELVANRPNPYDLALRKFIVSVDGVAQNRTPVPTPESLDKLASGNALTAEYNHPKAPVVIEKGNKIVYEFRIYNEGEVDANNIEIIDYLPEGLKLVENSEINTKFDWKVNGNEISTTKYVVGDVDNGTIKAFDKTNKVLSYGRVQVELELDGDPEQGLVLTNVAEIKTDDGYGDRDSAAGSIDKGTVNNNWTGHSENKDRDLDKNEYYKGKEDVENYDGLDYDDNDFEKVQVAGEQFDLSLQKFISEVNDEKLEREPDYDTTPLKNGKDDAEYTASKNPVNVETGNIVTFTLRVYNEGDIDGYAEEITDYIPEGLGFLVNYKTNFDNGWNISEEINSVKLSNVKNGTSHLKLEDFIDTESLDDVEIVLGKDKIKSTLLAKSDTSEDNLIKKFDGSDKLDYKDVKVSFIVVTEDEITLKNIAAITAEKDKDGTPIETDRGPGRDSTPVDDINPDDYTTGNEDDDDYDVIKTDKKDFDLALQKFITKLNDEAVTGREPVPSISNGKISYNSKTTDPLYVGNGDLVEYTLRIFNEGEIDGYAAEIKDDIPNGLVFVPDNETNKEYGWVMYDKDGKETTDPSLAASVKTTYLSKEASEDNLIGKFDGSNLLYKDVKLVFRVVENNIDKTITSEKRTLTNTAEITKNTDKDGNDIPDIDSTPDNNKQGEDDIDQEQVYVKYFDLALEKNLSKAIVTTNNETKEVTGDGLKIEIHKKNINSTSIQFVYRIKVTNEGEIEGYATEVTDYIPDGLSFNPANNPDWVQGEGNVIKTEALAKTLLKPGESAELEVVFDWIRSSDNIGKFVNVAEISEDWNPYDSKDIDSTPNNKVEGEDDQDDAPVWIGVVTGLGDRPYILLTSTVLVILATGIILIKKYVL